MSQLDYSSLVNQNRREPDNYVCATQWSKTFGKQWRDYKESARCKKVSTALAKKLDVRNSDIIQTKRGRDSETWVHPVIAVDFAEWLSTDFGIFVKEIFIRYLDGDAELGAEMMIRDHNKDRFERAKKRLLVCDTNKEVADIAAKHGANPANLHGDRYRGLYRKSAAQLRKESGVKANETPLNAMSIRDLTMNSLVNQLVAESGDPELAFEFGDNLRQGFEKTMKKTLTPLWEDKQLRPNQARKVLNSGQMELPMMA